MNCGRIDRLISAYLDGELSGIEMMLVRDHVRNCQACEALLESERRLKQVLSRLSPVRPAAGFEARLLESLNYAQIPFTHKAWQWLQLHLFGRIEPARAAVFGCAVLLLVALGHFPQYGEWNDAFGERQRSASLVSAFQTPEHGSGFVSVADMVTHPEPAITPFARRSVVHSDARSQGGFSVSLVSGMVGE
ncbi:MAG: zf-HC2 domain-containing protein [Armatimonadetes bacterium]|nr:zf-HC2 domain-containing protein [Armatimonadota bacterium]